MNSSNNFPLSRRALSAEASPIREMANLASQYEGDDLVSLAIGEPDFTTPSHIIEAAAKAAKNGSTHYTQNAGILELREAISEKMRSENKADFDPTSEIVVTNGAMQALCFALLAIVNPGSEVIFPTPCWPNYFSQVKLAEGKSILVKLPQSNGFQLDPDLLIKSITKDTAAIVLNSPNNPTGVVYDRKAINEVVTAAADNNAYVIADDVYEGLIYEGNADSIVSYVDHPENILVVNSCSKKYAMTGWRLGWLAGNKDIIEAATKLHQSTTSSASSVSQMAALEAITGDQGPIDSMKKEFQSRRDYVVDRIKEMRSVSCPKPGGAIYAFLDVSPLDGSDSDIAKRLLMDYGVVTVPGSGFGAEGSFLRLSTATSMDQLKLGLDRIEKLIENELN
ncbi:MAG TPA: pyridoxal phosphate-dependent aminotransferase [Halobacteriales archaeon]|uniref:pyridoxal phosphate-dependent aminotransferase n=1 Tax=Candidatus Hikarchaeum yamanae TaxID=2675326 RepID=UPI00184FD253|nr:pyridoxal phosphate-dependent aminotransferase [Halobacteriales archaeon]|tara:strand:- start:22806 stop:23987 length:1182 start_codon:yes stop_codon:yes gene_type:complete